MSVKVPRFTVELPAHQELDECLVGNGTMSPYQIVIYLQKLVRAVDVAQTGESGLELPRIQILQTY